MIKSIHLTNFFGFKDTTIDFNSDHNILVGINGSGKSNLLKAIRLLREGVIGKGLGALIIEDWGGIEAVFFKGVRENESQDRIQLEFVFDADHLSQLGYGFAYDVRYRIALLKQSDRGNFFVDEELFWKAPGRDHILLRFTRGTGTINTSPPDEKHPAYVRYEFRDLQELALRTIRDPSGFPALSAVQDAIAEIVLYDYFDTSPNSKVRRAMKATGSLRLNADGSNMPQIINQIKVADKVNYERIVTGLREVNEHFRGFDFNILGSGNFELMLDEEKLNSAVHVAHISDGTLRYLCLLAIIWNSHRGKLICIDEPESGLHPDMMLNIAKGIHEVSHDATFLIATHSENFLNQFRVEDIRVFEKDEENAIKVQSYSETDFEGWYESFSPGEMWRQGDLGGNRW